VCDGGSTGHEDDEGAFAADEVDEQLQEGVDGEGLGGQWCQYTQEQHLSYLIHVPQRLYVGGCCERDQTCP
jgi:hypothetical protein